MHSLRDLQRSFGNAILDGAFEQAATFIVEDGIPAAERLGIYRNNVRIGFRNTLSAEFPIVMQLGGEEWFNQVARQYHAKHPSRAGNLHFVGLHFPDFLRAMLGGTEHAYFADVARLEWAYQQVLIAAEAPAFAFSALHSVAPEHYGRLQFRLNPAAQLVGSQFPILAIWQAHRRESDAPQAEVAIDLANSPQKVLVLRRAAHVELRAISTGGFALLSAFERGESLADAFASACTVDPELDPADTLLHFAQLGVLSDFSLPDNAPIHSH